MADKAVILATGEIVNIEYDDDDLYKVCGRAQWLYRNDFRYIEDDELCISYNQLREILIDLGVDNDLKYKILQKMKEI